jgi:hypothetical protein
MPRRRPALRPAPEEELLLHAALGEGDAALDAFVRWRSATDFDRIDPGSMRLLPLVVHNLGSRFGDDDVAGRARGVAKYTWAHTQQVQYVMAPVLRALEGAGATAMLLKGWAFPDDYGGGGSLRTRYDLDLLVPEPRFAAATALLEDHGLSRRFDVVHGDQQLGDRHAVTFEGPGGLQVDLHRRALATINQPDAEQPFWDRARRIALRGAPCLAPAPADLLLMVLEHAWRWNPLDSGGRWVADAVVLLRSPEPFDWDRLAAMSERYWLTAVVDESLAYLNAEYATPYPAAARRRLAHAPRWTRVERRARARPESELSRRERASLWIGDAVRSSLRPGSRASFTALARAAAARARVRGPAFLPAEALYRVAGRPTSLHSMRRRWRPRDVASACGPLPLGEPLSLTLGSPWLTLLGEGWSLPERTGVWSDGPEATLYVPPPDVGETSLIVELDLFPFAPSGDERRVVDAFLDGRHRRLELQAADPPDQPVCLCADWRPGRAPLEIALVIRNPGDPIEHGIEDPRRLGVHLRSLALRRARDGGR